MNREILLEQAVEQVRSLVKQGYKDACVAPEYCIASIGHDKYWTYTITIYVGDKNK